MSALMQRQLDDLGKMTTGDLVQRYEDLHGHKCRTRHRAYLIRKIAWRIQANAEGGLSERAGKRAAELADLPEVREMAPKATICPPQPGPGCTTTRSVKGTVTGDVLRFDHQQFNTTSSMGRLTLTILLSFAQFEREIIGEHIRDKVVAQKRRGKWAGGVPVLGHNVERSGGSPRLVINAKEAAPVREILQMYLDKGSLQPVVTELTRRGWPNKRRITRKGTAMGGRPFDRATLYAFLTSPFLIEKIVHKDQVDDGEHEAIVEPALFERFQSQMRENGCTGGKEVRNTYGVLL